MVFLKIFVDDVAPILANHYTSWLKRGFVPDWWKNTYISMIPKAYGDLSDVKNWRGLCLLNYEYKVFTKLVDVWLRKEAIKLNLISEEQIGFTNGRWMQRNTILVQAFLQESDRNKCCAFLDLKNAYPSVRFKWFLKVMRDIWGEQGALLGLMLIGGNGRVCINNRLSSWFPLRRGVKQGDCAAPFCFNLCLEPILRELAKVLYGSSLWNKTVGIC